MRRMWGFIACSLLGEALLAWQAIYAPEFSTRVIAALSLFVWGAIGTLLSGAAMAKDPQL